MKITGDKIIDNGSSVTVLRESQRLLGLIIGLILGFIVESYVGFGKYFQEYGEPINLLLILLSGLIGCAIAKGHSERDIFKARIVKITRRFNSVTVTVSSHDQAPPHSS